MNNHENNVTRDFTKIPNHVIKDPSLSPYAKAIYILIKSYSPSYPSYNRIMEQTGIGSRSTINKGLSDLKAKGLIRIIDSPKYKSNLYEFPSPEKMDTTSLKDELKPVQEMDSNNTKLIIPNNKASGASTDPPVEASKRDQIFEEAISSLGTDASKGYISKERPTMIIEAAD